MVTPQGQGNNPQSKNPQAAAQSGQAPDVFIDELVEVTNKLVTFTKLDEPHKVVAQMFIKLTSSYQDGPSLLANYKGDHIKLALALNTLLNWFPREGYQRGDVEDHIWKIVRSNEPAEGGMTDRSEDLGSDIRDQCASPELNYNQDYKTPRELFQQVQRLCLDIGKGLRESEPLHAAAFFAACSPLANYRPDKVDWRRSTPSALEARSLLIEVGNSLVAEYPRQAEIAFNLADRHWSRNENFSEQLEDGYANDLAPKLAAGRINLAKRYETLGLTEHASDLRRLVDARGSLIETWVERVKETKAIQQEAWSRDFYKTSREQTADSNARSGVEDSTAIYQAAEVALPVTHVLTPTNAMIDAAVEYCATLLRDPRREDDLGLMVELSKPAATAATGVTQSAPSPNQNVDEKQLTKFKERLKEMIVDEVEKARLRVIKQGKTRNQYLAVEVTLGAANSSDENLLDLAMTASNIHPPKSPFPEKLKVKIDPITGMTTSNMYDNGTAGYREHALHAEEPRAHLKRVLEWQQRQSQSEAELFCDRKRYDTTRRIFAGAKFSDATLQPLEASWNSLRGLGDLQDPFRSSAKNLLRFFYFFPNAETDRAAQFCIFDRNYFEPIDKAAEVVVHNFNLLNQLKPVSEAVEAHVPALKTAYQTVAKWFLDTRIADLEMEDVLRLSQVVFNVSGSAVSEPEGAEGSPKAFEIAPAKIKRPHEQLLERKVTIVNELLNALLDGNKQGLSDLQAKVSADTTKSGDYTVPPFQCFCGTALVLLKKLEEYVASDRTCGDSFYYPLPEQIVDKANPDSVVLARNLLFSHMEVERLDFSRDPQDPLVEYRRSFDQSMFYGGEHNSVGRIDFDPNFWRYSKTLGETDIQSMAKDLSGDPKVERCKPNDGTEMSRLLMRFNHVHLTQMARFTKNPRIATALETFAQAKKTQPEQAGP